MKRKPDDEGNADQAKRLQLIDFSVPPPNVPQPPLPPMQSPLQMQTLLPAPSQPDGGYYMNNMAINAPWRGRGNPRGGQNFGGFNNRGGQNMWRTPRGGGPNQRNFRGGPGGYYRGGGGQKGNNQFNQQNFYGNQGFNAPNNYTNGPFSNQNYQNQGQWPQEMPFPNQEENCGNNAGSSNNKNKGQGGQASNSANVDGDQDMMDDAPNTKGKRRSMSNSYPSRPWDKESAEKALAVENECLKALRNQNLIIRFPDPDLNKDIVKAFHPSIVNVHFQVPSGPRFCFVQLEEGAEVDEVISSLVTKQFGTGVLQVEKRGNKDEDNLCAETIDPFTLYIGNLPSTITMATMREKFPTALRIDVGYAQRMKFTRYAFIRYNTAEAALEAFRESCNLQLENRSVIVRFRRQRGASSGPSPNKKAKNEGEGKQKKKAAMSPPVIKAEPVEPDEMEAVGTPEEVAPPPPPPPPPPVLCVAPAATASEAVSPAQPEVELETVPADEDDDDDDDDDNDDDENEEESDEEENEQDVVEDDDDDDDDDEDDEEEEEDDDDDDDEEDPMREAMNPGPNGDDDDDDDDDDVDLDDDDSDGDYE